MINDWFFWAIASALFFGFHAFLYRKLIEDHADILITQVLLATIVAFFSVVAVVLESGPIADNIVGLVLVAALQGILFFVSTSARLDALKMGLPSHILFPLLKLSTPIVILISVFLMNDTTLHDSPRKVLGVILTLGATWILIQWQPARGGSSKALGFAFLATVLSAGAVLASRYVYDNTDVSVFAFMAISNMTQMLVGIGALIYRRSHPQLAIIKRGMLSGLLAGVLSFAGFSAFLLAIKYGDLSRVAAVNSLYVLIPVLLSVVIYKETQGFTFRKQFALIISVVGVVLLK